MNKKRRDQEKDRSGTAPMFSYVITTYLTFWLMVLILCGGASLVFHAPPLVMRWLSNLCAWSPTIVLFVMYKKLRKGMTVQDFFRQNFSGKLRPGLIFICITSICGIFMLSAWVLSLWMKVPFISLFSMGGSPIWLTVILSLLSGPTGEECGWRGYLRYELQERYGFLKGNLILGVIWAFWHAVLWVVDNEYTSGWQLVIYIIANVLVLTALNMIMAVVMEQENNLVYACLIHFCFNLPYCLFVTNIKFYVIMSVFYLPAAVIFLTIRKKCARN